MINMTDRSNYRAHQRHEHPNPEPWLSKHKWTMGTLAFILLIIILVPSVVISANSQEGDGGPLDGGGETFAPTTYSPTSIGSPSPSASPTPPTSSACDESYRPNIIIMQSDDQGYGDRQLWNPSFYRMPNFERLAASGVDFRDGHSHSSVCSPSRFSIMTGEHWYRYHSNRGVLNSNSAPALRDAPSNSNGTVTTIASLLKSIGYGTYFLGKWHLGLELPVNSAGKRDWSLPVKGGPLEFGFDHCLAFYAFNGLMTYLEDDYYPEPPDHYTKRDSNTFGIQDTPSQKKYGWARCTSTSSTCEAVGAFKSSSNNGYSRSIGPSFDHRFMLQNLTKRAISYIDTHMESTPDQPFLVHMAWTTPHLPHYHHPDFDDNDFGAYVSVMEELDYRLGEILDTLDRWNITEDTFIVATSDNGPETKSSYTKHDLLPAAGLRAGKRSLYEGGHRVPFIVSWPRVMPAGLNITDVYVGQVDLLSTIAEMTGATIPDGSARDSFSSWRAICDTSNVRQSDIRSNQPMVNEQPSGSDGGGLGRSLRCGDLKLIPTSSSKWELYNISADPYEQNNIASSHSSILSTYKTVLKEIINNGFSDSTAIC